MKVLVEVPVGLHSDLPGRCNIESAEYLMLKNSVIGLEDRHEIVSILCGDERNGNTPSRPSSGREGGWMNGNAELRAASQCVPFSPFSDILPLDQRPWISLSGKFLKRSLILVRLAYSLLHQLSKDGSERA